jgi:hypothetical protein
MKIKNAKAGTDMLPGHVVTPYDKESNSEGANVRLGVEIAVGKLFLK